MGKRTNLILNRLIDYLLFVIIALALFYVGWLLKSTSIIFTIIFVYFAIVSLLIPIYDIKCLRFVVAIFLAPALLIKPIANNLQIILLTSGGIFFFFGCVHAMISGYELVTSTDINNQLIIFLSTTISFILSTQKWYGKVIDSITNRYHSMYQGLKYQPDFAKFLIYVYYFVALSISYTCQFLGKSIIFANSSELLSSFAVFLAYDRIVSNKRLLEAIRRCSLTKTSEQQNNDYDQNIHSIL